MNSEMNINNMARYKLRHLLLPIAKCCGSYSLNIKR
ncbi:hypothetical protein SVI_1599 [Shewanella violacea DSS12]|uniref:Uncharacterized protein n=1 Tax=Shewanella violacea (strain JCM 10179 / CIP 106290 / LMG 19151 / DSS12) TaxID=637905 RepID=D4ZIS1_SHEVD|nr:hypothetical protein SVI_1599 [Shewanella violacea DSS12]